MIDLKESEQPSMNNKRISWTTSSKKSKLISKQQFSLCLHKETLKTNSHNCSTETTSDFPVSSPSNPYGSSYKNPLPADSYERRLVLLTAQIPQMSLNEKINSWKCDLDLSDVEDVDSFDDLFKEHEKLKQKCLHGNKIFCEDLSKKQYDFTVFRKVLQGIKVTNNFKEKIVKLSNFPLGKLLAQPCMQDAPGFEGKKQQDMEFSDKNRSFKASFNLNPQKGFGNTLIHKYTENYNKDSNSQSYNNLKNNQLQSSIGNHQIFGTSRSLPLAYELFHFESNPSNISMHQSSKRNRTKSRGLIQERLDFAIQNKTQHLHEKRNQLFKTPSLQRDYLPSPAPVLLSLPMPITFNSNTTRFTSNNKNINSQNQRNLSEDDQIPAENSLISLPEMDQTLSAYSSSRKVNTPTDNFHQQHEFCNYLGLTGMTTASAVAEAVADLAKCNLTRRSLRVRRLKQIEKKVNEKKPRKNSRNDDEMVQPCNCEGISENLMNISENATEIKLQKLSKPALPLANERGISDKFIDKENELEKKAEIKIICKITAQGGEEKPIENNPEEIRTPKRRASLRCLKRDDSNSTSTCPRSSISDVEGRINNNSTPNLLRKCINNLQPDYQLTPTKISTCSSFKNIMVSKSMVEPRYIKQQLYNKFQKCLDASRKVKPRIYIVQALHNPDPPSSLQRKNDRLRDAGIETTFKGQKISISKKFSGNNHNNSQQHKYSDNEIVKVIKKRHCHSKRQKLSLPSKRKKKERLEKLLALATSWHKIKNSRQLRSRKILLVKKIMVAPKTRENPHKGESKNSQSEHSKVSLANSKSINQKNQERKNKYKRVHKSRRISKSTVSAADTSTDHHNPKSSNVLISSSIRKLNETRHGSLRKLSKSSVFENVLLDPIDLTISSVKTDRIEIQTPNIESETVVVSSTTNSYDEVTLLNNSPGQAPGGRYAVKNETPNTTKDHSTTSVYKGLQFLSSPHKELPNPANKVYGRVDYVYYEMDILIVVQEKMVSFWKYFKLINVLAGGYQMNNAELCLPTCKSVEVSPPQWLPLGECRRQVTDLEISTPYANRICVHNSMPIYIEMRCREIPRERRDCNLLSMYINAYYFNDGDMVAKMHSIQLDAVQGLPSNVIYTTITGTRYFVMSWPQENIMEKPRSGICKYSLTPNLDTLASIRDFNHMRHCIRYLECITDDKLIGFGDTQLTIWDHRSGDVLMNYDFNINLGQNLGSIYYPSLEVGQNSVLILFQCMEILGANEPVDVLFIACSISHTSPSHRILRRFKLPSLAFNTIKNAINIGDNIIITAENDEEIWINCSDPTVITRIPPQYSRRFYPRGKSQIIELTHKKLTVDSFANHVLKLAAKPAIN